MNRRKTFGDSHKFRPVLLWAGLLYQLSKIELYKKWNYCSSRLLFRNAPTMIHPQFDQSLEEEKPHKDVLEFGEIQTRPSPWLLTINMLHGTVVLHLQVSPCLGPHKVAKYQLIE